MLLAILIGSVQAGAGCPTLMPVFSGDAESAALTALSMRAIPRINPAHVLVEWSIFMTVSI
jgi:hypothetical protein